MLVHRTVTLLLLVTVVLSCTIFSNSEYKVTPSEFITNVNDGYVISAVIYLSRHEITAVYEPSSPPAEEHGTTKFRVYFQDSDLINIEKALNNRAVTFNEVQ